MSHYFVNDSSVKHQEIIIKTKVKNTLMTLKTDGGVFSKNALDFGSKVLLESLDLNQNLNILDLGCGYGPIGIYVAKNFNPKRLVLADINQRAVLLAKENCSLNSVSAEVVESNLFDNITGKFDIIISNPPIRAGKKVIYELYRRALDHLNLNGQLWLVIQKKQGAESTVTFLKSIYQEVLIVNKVKGYFIIKAY